MEAMRRRLGPFEVPLGEGELLEVDDAGARFRFALPVASDKLMVGTECSLRSGGREVLVTVEALASASVTVRASRPLELGSTATLVVYPWFLYEKLEAALLSLSPDRHPVQQALTLFGRGDPRHDPRPLVLDHAALNDSQRRRRRFGCRDHALRRPGPRNPRPSEPSRSRRRQARHRVLHGASLPGS
ncbi:MAG: hypothetical protein OEZ06_20420 [Myxococcales bacterium]|nr:hypothetical protein [Myxococcales bacterium]